jgi:uncharacterized protein (DUF433 family)
MPPNTTLIMNRITSSPDICHGKPCIRGLRYPVQNVLEWLASGMSTDEILVDYPDLEREDIHAAIAYAARVTQTHRIELIAA